MCDPKPSHRSEEPPFRAPFSRQAGSSDAPGKPRQLTDEPAYAFLIRYPSKRAVFDAYLDGGLNEREMDAVDTLTMESHEWHSAFSAFREDLEDHLIVSSPDAGNAPTDGSSDQEVDPSPPAANTPEVEPAKEEF